MLDLLAIANAVNDFMNVSKDWTDLDFLTFACMIHDEWASKHGEDAVENAKMVFKQVSVVNEELGPYKREV